MAFQTVQATHGIPDSEELQQYHLQAEEQKQK